MNKVMEFGSDFNFIANYQSGKGVLDSFYPTSKLYALGRHPLVHLLNTFDWKRIWMPSYFCYQVIDYVRKACKVEIVFYDDNPLIENMAVSSLDFQHGDVLLKINYFGLRGFSSNITLPVPVIEDHSHDLLSDWALNSDADWCIASLRKTLPIPFGGMLWSPKKLKLLDIEQQIESDLLAARRFFAMQLKSLYLQEGYGNKKRFRDLFVETEHTMDSLPLAAMDELTTSFLSEFSIADFYKDKRINYEFILNIMLEKNVEVLKSQTKNFGTPFSLVIVLKSKKERDLLRISLTKNQIYTAILWDIDPIHNDAKCIADRLISIHCDARYTISEMEKMSEIIAESMNNNCIK